MNRVICVPSRIEDVYRLARALRDNDRREIVCCGLDPRHAIRDSFVQALIRKTWFVDGELAAMGGMAGAMIGDVGEVYLLTTPLVERMPVTFLKEVKKAVREMLELRRILKGDVQASYTGACRLLECAGFTLGPPRPAGVNGELFRSFSITRGI